MGNLHESSWLDGDTSEATSDTSAIAAIIFTSLHQAAQAPHPLGKPVSSLTDPKIDNSIYAVHHMFEDKIITHFTKKTA